MQQVKANAEQANILHQVTALENIPQRLTAGSDLLRPGEDAWSMYCKRYDDQKYCQRLCSPAYVPAQEDQAAPADEP